LKKDGFNIKKLVTCYVTSFIARKKFQGEKIINALIDLVY